MAYFLTQVIFDNDKLMGQSMEIYDGYFNVPGILSQCVYIVMPLADGFLWNSKKSDEYKIINNLLYGQTVFF
ncbi:hypothetical protein SAMN05444349_103198 [Bacteroides faecichinchillae]|uniref:Uncharacterized protein n=1 Tax=Bacteroides faecichinchillae TaxID=871325 RepID=A0A1M4ULI9_9BACE|nr:hypothetical protein SAMN05444349_103198 [Bacteroides faecichinchillae]